MYRVRNLMGLWWSGLWGCCTVENLVGSCGVVNLVGGCCALEKLGWHCTKMRSALAKTMSDVGQVEYGGKGLTGLRRYAKMH